MHVYGIQGNGTEEFIYREAMEKQTYRIDLWTWGEGREGKMYVESNMETYITICKINNSLQEFAVCLRKLKQGLYINLVAWDGEGDEREDQRGGADSC